MGFPNPLQSSLHSSLLVTNTGDLNHRGADVMRNNRFSVHHSWLRSKTVYDALLHLRGADVMGINQSFVHSSGLLTKTGAFLKHGGADVTGINQSSVHYSVHPTKTGYDVFLNHRGPDVKESIASLIFHNLENKGFKVFFDKNSIQAGENVPQAIEEAIHSATVHIVIFSPNYVRSVWCLKELQLILKTGAPIIPVFCGIQPCELRMKNEEGVYARTFNKHTGRFESHVLEEWKKGLSEVSFTKGYIFEGDQGQLLEEVAMSVTQFIDMARFQPKQGIVELKRRKMCPALIFKVIRLLSSIGKRGGGTPICNPYSVRTTSEESPVGVAIVLLIVLLMIWDQSSGENESID